MKKLTVWALIIMLCLSMVACGQEETPAEAPTEVPTEAPTEAPTETTEQVVNSEPFDWNAVGNLDAGPGCAGDDGGADE